MPYRSRQFATRHGPATGRSQRRYLWTDAFGLYNLLSLYRRTGDRLGHGELRRLVENLGR